MHLIHIYLHFEYSRKVEFMHSQCQLPLADGFRVMTRVPGIWGLIPFQVDTVTTTQ